MRTVCKSMAAMATSGALLLGLTSCALSNSEHNDMRSTAPNANNVNGSNSGSQWLTKSTAETEYRTTIKSIPYPLPPGQEYPRTLPQGFISGDPDVRMQVGGAAVQVWFTWLCAWESSYLDATSKNDTATANNALAMIEKWPTTNFYQTRVDDPTNAWEKNVVEPAKLGSPAGVSADYQAMCYQYPTVKSANK